jgi:hypothetical protein
VSEAAQIVNDYLMAFTSGDIDKALSFVSDEFSFRGPMSRLSAKKRSPLEYGLGGQGSLVS